MQTSQESGFPEFDPKRVQTVVDGSRLICPEHSYPINRDGTDMPVCYHHSCRLNWRELLVQLPAAFELKQAAALLVSLTVAESVQVLLDLQKRDRDYARQLKQLLPRPVTRVARSAALTPAGAAG